MAVVPILDPPRHGSVEAVRRGRVPRGGRRGSDERPAGERRWRRARGWRWARVSCEEFQRTRSYARHAVAITVRVVATVSALAYTGRSDMLSFLVLLLALLNDGRMLTISTDAVTLRGKIAVKEV